MRSATVAAICGVVAALLVVLVAAPSQSEDESARALNHASSVEDERSQVAPQATTTPVRPESADWTKTVAPGTLTYIGVRNFPFTAVDLGSEGYSVRYGVEIESLPSVGTLQLKNTSVKFRNDPPLDVDEPRFVPMPELRLVSAQFDLYYLPPVNFTGETTFQFQVVDRIDQLPARERSRSPTYELTLRSNDAPGGPATPTPAQSNRPAKPTGLQAFAGPRHSQATLVWHDPNDATITGYQYQYALSEDAFTNAGWVPMENSGAETIRYEFRDLIPDIEYFFRIRAMKGLDGSEPSEIVSTKPVEPGTEIPPTPAPIPTFTPTPTSIPTATPPPTATPYTRSQAMITRIEPAFNEITVAPGDDVRLRLDFYGLQGIKDSKLATDDLEFAWEASEDTSSSARQLVGDESTILYRVPSRQGTYTVTASLGREDCIGRGDDDCTASFVIQTRRSSPIEVPTPLPAPTGEVATRVASDQDGNEYVVINHSQGGGFDQDGYSIRFRPGVVVQGEIVPVRMERLGLADSQNPLDLRHMLGGYRYGIYLPGETQARLNAPGAEVCIPLAAELRASLSRVDLLAIDDTSGNTVLSSFTPISPEQVQVCGNISRLPAEVAAGTFGTPVAVPTQPVEEVLEAPDTGGASPASSTSLLLLVIGLTLATTGVVFIGLRRRRTRDGSPS